MVFILKITKGNNSVNVFRMSIIDPCTSSDDALNLFILPKYLKGFQSY